MFKRMTDFQEVRAMDIRLVVRLPEWQELRASLVGTWKFTPKTNVARLRQFYNPDDPIKTRIVLNYLTGSGFRTGAICCPEADAFREEVRENWRTKLSDGKRTTQTGQE